MSTSLLLYVGSIPLVVLLFWVTTAFFITASFAPPNTLRNARIVLLIAHPDDEAMFFAPSLLALTEPGLGNHLKVLCLSTGDADGMGAVRRGELVKSAVGLGVRREEDVFVLDDKRFRDGMDQVWAEGEVARVLGEAFTPEEAMKKNNNHNLRNGDKDKEKPTATIDVLITFDAGGVSGHPNHRALYQGAVLFLKSLMKGHGGWECPVTLYTLPSVNILRKYSGVLDAMVTMAVGGVANIVGGVTGDKKMSRADRGKERVLFMSGVQGYWKAREAMVKGHKSQMVWFRWGWITVGRYMYINDLKRTRFGS